MGAIRVSAVGGIAATSLQPVDTAEREHALAELKAANRKQKAPAPPVSCGACGWTGTIENYERHKGQCSS